MTESFPQTLKTKQGVPLLTWFCRGAWSRGRSPPTGFHWRRRSGLGAAWRASPAPFLWRRCPPATVLLLPDPPVPRGRPEASCAARHHFLQRGERVGLLWGIHVWNQTFLLMVQRIERPKHDSNISAAFKPKLSLEFIPPDRTFSLIVKQCNWEKSCFLKRREIMFYMY